MVWFSEDVVSTEMIFENFMTKLKNIPLEEGEDYVPQEKSEGGEAISPSLKVKYCNGKNESICF